jgi:hypothetical protein
MTIELVGFRNGGLQGVSKSEGMLIRLWDLSGPGVKPPYKDVPNTRDALVSHATLLLITMQSALFCNRNSGAQSSCTAHCLDSGC